MECVAGQSAATGRDHNPTVSPRHVPQGLERLEDGADSTGVPRMDEERILKQKVLKARRKARRTGAIGAAMASAGLVLLALGGLTVLRSAVTLNTEQQMSGLSVGFAGGVLLSLGAVPLALQAPQREEHDTLLGRLNMALKERPDERRFPVAKEELARSV